jgi:hypothetical protein
MYSSKYMREIVALLVVSRCLFDIVVVDGVEFGPFNFPGHIEIQHGGIHERAPGAIMQGFRDIARGLLDVMPSATILTSAQYINYFPYSGSNCRGGVSNQYSLGMGICVRVNSTGPGTNGCSSGYSSLLFQFDSVNYQVLTYYYANIGCWDDACGSSQYADFKSTPPSTCHTSNDDDDVEFMYTITTGYSLPGANGFWEK